MGGVTVGEIKWTCGIPHISGVPHLPAILVALSWDTPCCTHIFDKKLCSFPPPPPPLCWFFCFWHENSQKPFGGGGWGGAENTPTVPINVTRVDEYCSPRLIKLGRPVLYPYSDKKACSLPPPCCFFCFWHATTTTTIKALFSWP